MNAEVVATDLSFPEGPVVWPDGTVTVCELMAGTISAYDGTMRTVAHTGGAPNGCAAGSDGNLYVTQNGDDHLPAGIQRVSMDGSVEFLFSSVGSNQLLYPNDLCFGPDGRLWFTDPAHPFDPRNPLEDGRIYAVGNAGGEMVVRTGPTFTNGLGFLADGSLCWVETYTREVHVLSNGGSQRLTVLPEKHLPDGFAVAVDGRIFIASVFSHGVSVLDANGTFLELIRLADDSFCTNCAFDSSTLWVTDVAGGGPNEGRLWRIDTDAQGLPLHTGVLS